MKTSLLPVVILAGGLATRIKPLTLTTPKSLLTIANKPFIFHQLALLEKQQITDVILCVGYLGEQIRAAVGDGAKFGMRIQYHFDGETLLGTAGAIKNASHVLPQQFFLLNGDSYLLCEYLQVQRAFEKSQKLALMTVFKNDGKWDTSNVEFMSHKIIRYNKVNRNERMCHIDYGLEVFDQQAFASVPRHTPYDLNEVYQVLVQDEQLSAYDITERFYEVGSFLGIREFEQFIAMTKPF
jgi:MurNAc alpha-1-phosphate uridylyltransferase